MDVRRHVPHSATGRASSATAARACSTGPAPELEQGCCSYGAHFTDKADRKRVEPYAERLDADQWQFHDEARRSGRVAICKNEDGDGVTRLVDGACIFLNRPGFAGGAGCALHIGRARGRRAPHRLEARGVLAAPAPPGRQTDDNGHVTSTVREWKRRDWGEGGVEFHWWCTDAPDAFVAKEPVYITLADELVETVGKDVYKALAEHLDERRRRKTYLPHPQVRR